MQHTMRAAQVLAIRVANVFSTKSALQKNWKKAESVVNLIFLHSFGFRLFLNVYLATHADAA